jgi:hypothetical protein
MRFPTVLAFSALALVSASAALADNASADEAAAPSGSITAARQVASQPVVAQHATNRPVASHQVADHPVSTQQEANQHPAPTEVYEGIDTTGRRIRLTISDAGPEVLVRIDRGVALPAAHWTSLIGTGGAAAAER